MGPLAPAAIARAIFFTILLFLLSLPSAPLLAQSEPLEAIAWRLIEADETGVTLDLRLLDFSVTERILSGQTYQVVEAPGLAAATGPGQPRLPSWGRLLGTPGEGIAGIEILEQETEVVEGVWLEPTPTLTFSEQDLPPVEIFQPDADLYQQDAFWPATVAEIGETGRLRDQPVAQIRLYPFRYNPVQQRLEVSRHLRMRVHFASSAGRQSAETTLRPATPYESMLAASLINYETLPPSSPASPSQAAVPPRQRQAQTPALKIFVEEEGLYQVTYEDLEAAGFAVEGSDPRHWHLLNDNQEAAIFIDGEADGRFDPGDRLEFYGQGMTGDFTRRNVYWLTVGDEPGQRMATENGTPQAGDPTPEAFYNRLHLEENKEYWPHRPLGSDQDYWFWERFPSTAHSSDFLFTLQNIPSIAAVGRVRVTLHGRTNDFNVNPDHHTQVFLNGTLIDEAWWDGETPLVHDTVVPQPLFREGENILTVTSPGDTGAAVDGFYVNYFEIEYWDQYLAEEDRLHFRAAETGRQSFSVSGFSSQTIDVYDVSQPQQVKRLLNGTITAVGDGYEVRVAADVAESARYLALTASQKQSPAGFQVDTPSDLTAPTRGADYIIITPEDFMAAAQRLADYRAGQGLRVSVVNITDVYDEFSAGRFTPQAIRDFLEYAYQHWTPPAPLYVLLIGDANYDYQDYLGTGAKNYMPVHLFESEIIGQTSTDNWFVSVSGDDPLPDMLLGRLSVQKSSQANNIIDKILAYEQQTPTPGAWQQQALFVADDASNFTTVSDSLIEQLPPPYTPQRLYGQSYPNSTDVTPDIIDAVDQGALLVNYVGHGGVTGWFWEGQGVFRNSHVNQLNNSARYPFLITGNCNNGLLAHPTDEAFAERFVNAPARGGIAAWSPTGLGYPLWHEEMVEALYGAIFDEYQYQVGAATTAAKVNAFAQLGWREPIEMFTLFGDPALALQVVQPQLAIHHQPMVSHVQPGQSLTYILDYQNVGNQRAEHVTISQLYDDRTTYLSATPLPDSGDQQWLIGDLPVNASGTILVTVNVSDEVADDDVLTNQAIFEGDNFSPRTVTAYTLVGESALGLSYQADVTGVKPGQWLTYTLTYTNNSFQLAESLVLTATYDAYTHYQQADPPPTTGDNVWQIGSLSAGESRNIQVTVRVAEETPGGRILLSQATLTGAGGDTRSATAYNQVDYFRAHLPLILRLD